jgi:hypothetical protein
LQDWRRSKEGLTRKAVPILISRRLIMKATLNSSTSSRAQLSDMFLSSNRPSPLDSRICNIKELTKVAVGAESGIRSNLTIKGTSPGEATDSRVEEEGRSSSTGAVAHKDTSNISNPTGITISEAVCRRRCCNLLNLFSHTSKLYFEALTLKTLSPTYILLFYY